MGVVALTVRESVSLESARRGREGWVYVVVFLLLAVWAWVFPYSGDGDSTQHYVTACTGFANLPGILSASGRPVQKLLIMGPAQLGIYPTRLFCAAIAVILAWQTVCLARDLGLRAAGLALPLLIFQPFVFVLASDTMTELPMALGMVIAVRLWMARRTLACLLLVSMLPMVRPEGLLLIALWAVLVLARMRRPIWVLPLGAGMAIWMGACWVAVGTPLHVFNTWWPYGGYAAYGQGAFYDYAARWVFYCGPVLIVLFLAGLGSIRRMPLIWAIWGIVFVAHSVMFWQGKFASAGLLRILACTSPMTALACLCGWDWLTSRVGRPGVRRGIAGAGIAAAALWAMFSYCMVSEHYRCFGYRALGRFAREQQVLQGEPRVFAGDKLFLAEMRISEISPLVAPLSFNRDELRRKLQELPKGTIGAWDDQQAQSWYGLTVDDLVELGYEVIDERTQRVPRLDYPRDVVEMRSWPAKPFVVTQSFFLVRKARLCLKNAHPHDGPEAVGVIGDEIRRGGR